MPTKISLVTHFYTYIWPRIGALLLNLQAFHSTMRNHLCRIVESHVLGIIHSVSFPLHLYLSQAYNHLDEHFVMDNKCREVSQKLPKFPILINYLALLPAYLGSMQKEIKTERSLLKTWDLEGLGSNNHHFSWSEKKKIQVRLRNKEEHNCGREELVWKNYKPSNTNSSERHPCFAEPKAWDAHNRKQKIGRHKGKDQRKRRRLSPTK